MASSLQAWAAAEALIAALAVGLVVGVERGWGQRDVAEGGRVAGLRTFTLVGLLGGVLGLLLDDTGAWPLPAALLGLAALLAVAFREASRRTGNLSITTAVATVLTLMLGVLAARGAELLALSAAVVVAVLLSLKPTLHRWLQLVKHQELSAALQLLVLSVVILPHLPDAGYGPYQALNPYRLWWAVVLIAGLSLAGHFAMRLTGARRGVFWTGVLGGLASSTAATLALSRLARRRPALAGAAAAGALAACGVMFLRIAVLVASIQPALLRPLGAPTLATAAALLGVAGWQWHRAGEAAAQGKDSEDGDVVDAVAGFDLATALGFGAGLAVLAVLVPAAREALGDAGVYALAAVSGLADVDATVISMARAQADGALGAATAVAAIGLATLVNMVSKAAIAQVTGGAAVGAPVLRGYVVGMAVGALAAVAVALA